MNEKPQTMPPVPPFVQFVASSIPMTFDDSLSYYEALCALWKYVQGMTDVINNNATLEEEFIEKVNELETYVHDYFDNLDVQEEINNKLDAMAQDGTLADIMAEYAATKVDYFYITSDSTSSDILSAFASTKTKVIEFENGTYTLSDDLIITSNTTVNLNGSTLSRSSNSYWFLGYGRDSSYTGFNGVHNVHFNNGSIELPIALMHNADISFTNIDFLPVNDHAIQMAGCKDITIDGCVFEGRIINDSIADHFEAVQLESATRSGQPFLNDSDSPSYDHQGNYNIRITNCKFNSGNATTTKMYTGIGGHSKDTDNLYPAENVIIDNCSFSTVWYAQICPCGFKNSRITNSIFNIENNTGAVQNIRFRYFNDNILIENNTFIGGRNNITNVNSDGYCNKLQLINNTFDSEWNDNLCNVIIANWQDVLIQDNDFRNAKNYSVYVGSHSTYVATRVKIIGNTFKVDNLAATGENLYLRYCSNVEIYNNTFVRPAVSVSGKYSILATNDAGAFKFANNNIIGNEGTFMTGVTDYTNIFGIQALSYLTDSSIYTAIDDQTPDIAFSQFEKLILVLHKNQDPNKLMYCYIEPYTPGKKVYLNRSYSFVVTDGTTTGSVTFKINEDGTFDYTSSDSFTLRRIFGLNS